MTLSDHLYVVMASMSPYCILQIVYFFFIIWTVRIIEWQNNAKCVVGADTTQIPAVGASFTYLHICCCFQRIVFQWFTWTYYPINFKLFRHSQHQMRSNWKIKQSILISLIELLKTSPKYKMIELLLHGQHSPTIINHRLHLHQSELIQPIWPYIHCVFIFY